MMRALITISLLALATSVSAYYLGTTCSSDAICRVSNSECGDDGVCVCKYGFGNVSNYNSYCYSRYRPGSNCNIMYADRCWHNSDCTMTSLGGQGSWYYKCICNNGYYMADGDCKPRLGLGQACEYHEKHCSDECDVFGGGQCPDHAACRPEVGVSATGQYVCKCVEEYYKRSNGICVKEIPLGGKCTINDVDRCVTANAECVVEDGRSLCRCSEGYRKDGYHSCVNTVADDESSNNNDTGTDSDDSNFDYLCVPAPGGCVGPQTHPGDRHKYIQCDATCSHAIPMDCAANLVWDDAIKTCNWP